MGTRGPIPEPDSGATKRGRNTATRKGPARGAATVGPPAFIHGNAAAMQFWQEHAPPLVAAKRLRPEHAATFGIVCELAAECRALVERVAAEGAVVSTGRGTRANPACRLLRDARRDLFNFGQAFGLTAMSDARLPAEPEPDEKDSLLNRFIRGAKLTPDELEELGDD